MNELLNNILTSKDLHFFLKKKGENHNWYKFYSSEKIIEEFIAKHSLFLSTGDSWNDTVDKVNFNSLGSSDIRFGLCLSYTKSENVAMWLLYSKKNGLMVDFGKDVMEDCMDAITIECGSIKNDIFQPAFSLSKPNFRAEIVDIVYYGETKDGDLNSFYIKRADESVQNCPRTIVNDLNYSKKTLPWQYECECRFIITVNKSISGIESCDTVRVPFQAYRVNDLTKRVYHSPNHSGSYKYAKSKLTGLVKWEF